jgi:hypothetical protein
VSDFSPHGPEVRAASKYTSEGPSGLRRPPMGNLELAAQSREHLAFLAGIRWERERQEAIRKAHRDEVLAAIAADIGRPEDL